MGTTLTHGHSVALGVRSSSEDFFHRITRRDSLSSRDEDISERARMFWFDRIVLSTVGIHAPRTSLPTMLRRRRLMKIPSRLGTSRVAATCRTHFAHRESPLGFELAKAGCEPSSVLGYYRVGQLWLP